MTPSRRWDPMEHGTRAPRLARLAIGAVLALLATMPVAAAQAAPPDNDDFANAQLVQVGDRVTGTTDDATLQSGEPAAGASYTRSVWYRLTPSASETLRIDNCASGGWWAQLAIYTGPGLGDLTEAPLTRSGCSSGSRVYLDAVAATTYYVRITGLDPGPGYSASGSLVLSVARPQAPANDDFENAEPTGRPARITGTTVDATVQAGEPAPAVFGGSGRSVWYKLTATSSDFVVASISPAANDPMVALYTGSSVGSLTEVGTEGGPTGPRTTMSFITQPGTTYYIAVQGRGDGTSDFTLNVSAPSPPPPPGDLTPPPAPTCPIQFANTVPGERCTLTWTVIPMLPRALPLVDRRFGSANSYSTITGTLPTNRGARGTLQVSQASAGQALCTSATLTWTATTTVTRTFTERRVRSAADSARRARADSAMRTVRPDDEGRTVRLAALRSRATARATAPPRGGRSRCVAERLGARDERVERVLDCVLTRPATRVSRRRRRTRRSSCR